ncbi:MAG: hypothetical protein ABSA39_21895 [Edaphobacter sp.]
MTVLIDRRKLIVGAGSTTLLGALGTVLGLVASASPTGRASKAEDPPGYDAMFALPYAHALMNANLAKIGSVDPAHPDEPRQIVYQGDGVEANIISTGVAGTKSLNASPGTGYGIPAISVLQDIFVLRDGDHQDCLVLSTILFPFYEGGTQSHAVTQCNQPPDLTGRIASYVIDRHMVDDLIAAANLTGQQIHQAPGSLVMIRDEIFMRFDKAMRTSVGGEINRALGTLNAPKPFEITTGDLMAPFLVFSVPTFDKNKRTVDILFSSVGFSTMLRTVDSQSHQVLLGTALSLQASGQGHISEAGVDLNLNYKFNVGSGLLPLGSKFATQINAMISKLESHIKKLFLAELDGLLFVLGGFPNSRLLSAPRHQVRSLSRWAGSSERRSSSLIP